MDILLDISHFQAYSVILLMVTLAPASSVYLYFANHKCDLGHEKQVLNMLSQRTLNREFEVLGCVFLSVVFKVSKKRKKILTLRQLQPRHLPRTAFSLLESVAFLALLDSPPFPNRCEPIRNSFQLIFDILNI